MKIQSYRDLLVWKKAMDLVVECYKFVIGLPKNETYGLISQTQRAAVSITCQHCRRTRARSLGILFAPPLYR
ncbi:MAG: four helix bundle protein [Blastocatellia bacterium]